MAKIENKKPSKLSSILVFLIGIYVCSLIIPRILHYTNIEQAIVVNCLQIIVVVLALILTPVLVAKNNNAWPLILILPLILFIGSLFAPLTAPYSKFPLYVVRCGGWPIVANDFAGGRSYTVSADSRFYKVTPFTDYYFCTEEEAQAAGFSQYPGYHNNY